ncbi:ShlB/FhaC/HecB family hemolysin secretion/activation protein [Pseudomonas sp. KNUC1026]|uniref:ShlB/FhaC/HecB family hemolysin secretion/activation protein n=1 Tax=Pseudomonas sp. KNUC1026 TaxID=2893890 RepID=UPI001F287231|nr:ShlB/FhaC/HecB family hemolysin secretion/activation protein [Pseudomonas sp. KNUC1026]UFH50128.1 ShlB/FhaC/HecB family hemolysin secretion/activation protein [Pseudomonas sp. KNUC1026]
MKPWPLLCLLACLMPSALAGPDLPSATALQRERQAELLEHQQKRLEALQRLPGAAPPVPAAAVPKPGQCFVVQRLQVEGVTALPAEVLDRLASEWQGRCLEPSSLDALLRQVTHLYLERGLITSRAYLPAQSLGGGTLVIQVLEGRLQGVRAEPGTGPSERELAMAFPGSAGQLLNVRDIEQMLDRFARLPSRQVSAQLTPGDTPGTSWVQLEGQRSRPWQAGLSQHNNGQPGSGERQWAARSAWDSPLGLADQVRLNAAQDAYRGASIGSASQQLHYSVPWQWWLFSYSHSRSEYRMQPGPGTRYGGRSQQHAWRAERTVQRSSAGKTAISAGLSSQRGESQINGTRLAAQGYRLSEWQWGLNHGRRLGSGFLNLDLGLHRGVGASGAQGQAPQRLQAARYRKQSATLSYLQPFEVLGERVTFSTLATGQRSADTLHSAQRIGVGGLAAVRAYKTQSLSADSGGYWRTDLRWSRPLAGRVLNQYGIGLGYDAGAVRANRQTRERAGRATGHALELFARGPQLGLSLTLAHSLERPAALPRRERPVYFNLDLDL